MTSVSRGVLPAAFAAVLALVCYSPLAASEEPTSSAPTSKPLPTPPAQSGADASSKELQALREQVRLLEEKLRQLSDEVEQLRRVAPASTAHNESTSEWFTDDIDTPEPSCDEPYDVDLDGIKRFRTECLERASLDAIYDDCANPFYYGRDGIKRMRMECPVNGDDCDAPFYFGKDGVKRVHLKCL
jgi:hypothetical protein